MEFRVLGPLEVEGVPSLGAPKQRALLALLLLARGEVVSEGRLVDGLWGEEPPETARHALQVYVSGLRKAIAPTGAEIRRQGGGYALVLRAAGLDAARFEELARDGAKALADGDAASARAQLREALGLWRGRLLADLEDELATTHGAALEELRLRAAEDLAEAELALGLHDELVPRLEAAVREQPFRERPLRLLMLALYRAGRQTEALETYRSARERLRGELGLDPGRELRELEAAILRQDPSLDLARADVRLPAPVTSLVGREAETAAVLELLTGARLVTLTGPGGIGKTRLAIAIGARAAAAYDDGARFVSLADVADPALVADAIARELDVEEGAAGLASHLRTRELLLVVDNLEHVADASPLLSELLVTSPHLAVLATSRVPLGLYGEHEYAVPPLPPADAVELFSHRARAVGPPPRESERAAVAEICERLDRLPLAIELAAARTRELSPTEMLPLLDRRRELAARGPRDVSPRQYALRTAIEWSHALLDGSAADAFAALAVFAGGWTRESAAAIGVDGDALDELVRQSLVHRERSRYAMLETIREYALELLDRDPRADELRRRHAGRMLEVAEGAAAAADY